MRRPLLKPGLLANAVASAFESFVLPLADLGSGQVDTKLQVGSGSATFTRATTAWTKLASGLWAEVASGVPRSCYLGLDTAVGVYAGYLAEGARTNEVLWNRDLTNAAWTKVSTTVAKDQTGIDGVSNSASSLLATGANATTLQVITEAAATRDFSAFVKRLVGTGEIDMTEDGGLTWTNVTAQINSSTYTRVAIPSQSVLNPNVGFRIVTSGDKIAVDMCQNEAGTFASSPIPTTTVAVTRNADILTYPGSGNIGASAGTVFAEVSVAEPITSSLPIIQLGDGTGNERINNLIAAGAGSIFVVDGGVTQANIVTANLLTANTSGKLANSYSLNNFKTVLNGGTVVSDLVGTLPTMTEIQVGHNNTVVAHFGTIKNARIWTVQLSDAQLQGLTA